MAETSENDAETDLSALLDSALEDFGRTRNTDDELDSMMDTMDQQAVQKAAQKFDDVMKTFQSSSNHTVFFFFFQLLICFGIMNFNYCCLQFYFHNSFILFFLSQDLVLIDVRNDLCNLF
ncbi:unnamed protein product [Onchocerca flexuosa]|uniref:t-SNARE coiled-coil homology domain-containing protein n=1 Tax=Onchocerca flexuosa TaxID=387005 RepID=A0A183HRI0_9BILA|nr:unnamed protein product [Onchocerca flexuosa]